MKMNMVADRAMPIIHANFFCCAPTYSGTWLPTIKRPIIKVGENLGLMNTRITKSARNMVITYFMGKKLFLKIISIKEMNVAKNSIPADALISLSFKTGMLYPFTFSPNCIIFFIFSFLQEAFKILTQEYLIKENMASHHQQTAGYGKQKTRPGQLPGSLNKKFTIVILNFEVRSIQSFD